MRQAMARIFIVFLTVILTVLNIPTYDERNNEDLEELQYYYFPEGTPPIIIPDPFITIYWDNSKPYDSNIHWQWQLLVLEGYDIACTCGHNE